MTLRTNMLVSVGLLLSVSPAAQATSLQALLTECRAMSNGVERLACYDAINITDLSDKRPMPEQMDKTIPEIAREKRQQAQEAASPQPEQAPPQPEQAVVSATKTNPQSQFGLKVKSEVQALEDITDTVVEVTKSARGKKVIHMKSGAVWQQVDSAYFKLEDGMGVYIERGALGSFYLSHEGVNRRIKVKRIK